MAWTRRRVLTGLAVAAGVIALALVGVARLGWGRDAMRAFLERQVAGALDGTLHIGGVSGSIVGGLTVTNVRFTHDGHEVFMAAAIDARFSVWRWLRGDHTITSIRIVDPEMHVAENDDEWSVSQWVRRGASTDGAAAPLRLPRVQIVNGSVHVAAVERVWRLPAEWRKLNAEIAVTTGAETRVELQRLAFTTRDAAGRAFAVTRASGVLTFHQGARLDMVRVESDAGTIEVTGTIGEQHPRVLNLTATLAAVDTARWRTFSGLLETVDLAADGTLTFTGPVERLSIASALTTTAGRANGTTTIENTRDRLRVSGDLVLARADAARFTSDSVWRSDLNGRVRFVADHAGTPVAWTARVTLDGGPFRAFGADFDQLHGGLSYRDDVVTFSTDARAYGATLRGAGAITVRPALLIDVHGDQAANVDPRRLPADWGFLPLDASIAATAFAVRWTSGHWTVDTTLGVSHVEGATFAAGTTVRVASDPGLLRIAADGVVRALDGRRMGVATGLTGLNDPIFVTDLNGRFHVEGEGPDLADIDLSATASLETSTAAAGATIAATEVTYTRRSHLNTAHVTGAIAHLNPTPLGASAALASDINGDADLTAVWRDDVADVAGSLTASGTLRAGASILAELPITGGIVTGEWRDGRFRIDRGDVRNRGARASATGWMALTRGESAVAFDVSATDVGPLEPWTGRKANGSVTGHGTLDGAFDAPHVVATFAGPLLSDPELGRYDQVSGRADVVFPEWYLDRMRGRVTFDAATMRTAGGTVAERLTSVNHFTSRFSVDEARVTTRVSGIDLAAVMSADWKAESTSWIRALEARRAGRVWRFASASAPLMVSTSHVAAHAAVFESDAQQIVVDGRLAWSALESGGDPDDHLTIRATAVSLSEVDAFLDLGVGGTGTMAGQLSLEGRLSDPRGRLSASGRDLTVRGYRLADVTLDVMLAGGAADTSVRARQTDGLTLSAAGRSPLLWWLPAGTLDAAVPAPTWAMTAVSDPINLEIFAGAAPGLATIGGQALVDVRITGAAMTPAVVGTVAIADGHFRVPKAGVAFSDVFADIALDVDTLTVRRFRAHDARGRALNVTGQLAMNERQLDRVDVHLEADRLLVVDNAMGTIELSSLLELKGDLAKPRLTGNLEVASGRVEVDRLLRALQGDPLALVVETDLPEEGTTRVDLRAAATPAVATTSAAAFDTKSFLSALTVDVQVFAPDNLVLRGNTLRPGGRTSWSLGDLNVTVGGDLRAQRAAGDEVRLRGDVTTVRGSYTFENRRFELQRGGRIRFQGESPLDPAFDVRGVRTIDGVEARVDVRGRLSAPRLQLGSNLPLDEADVLSMILFNRPVNQLGDAQRADLVGAAASVAGGYVTAPLAQSLGRALDLDLLEVETVSFGQNVAPRVRVGQRLTSKLFVQFAQQFGAASVSELTAEYQLAKFLRLQGSTAQGPGSRAQRSLLQRTERVSLDLLFFFNY